MTGDTWYQQALTPPRVLEINLRIGIIPEEDHAQVLAEIKDPTNGILIGQWSCPHATMHSLPDAIQRGIAHCRAWIDDEVEPF